MAEKGKFELQTIYTFGTATRQFDSESKNIDRESTNTHTLTQEITYGLLDTLEVSLDIGWAFLNDDTSSPSAGNGLTDLVLIPKWNFYTSKNNWSFVYSPVLIMPTGDESDADEIGPGQGFWTLDQKIALTKNWEKLTFNTDAGFALPLGEKKEDYRGTLYWDGALGYQITPLLQPLFEINTAYNFYEEGEESASLALTVGTLILGGKNWFSGLGLQHIFIGKNTDKSTQLMALFKLKL